MLPISPCHSRKTTLITRVGADQVRDFTADCLHDLYLSEGKARANTRLLLTSPWNNLFMHSTTLMVPMLQLAERLSNEDIVLINEAQFKNPVQSELGLEAQFLEPNNGPTVKPKVDTVLRCTTSSGRQVVITGVARDEPIWGGTWEYYERFFHDVFPKIVEIVKAQGFKKTLLQTKGQLTLPLPVDLLDRARFAEKMAIGLDIAMLVEDTLLPQSPFTEVVSGMQRVYLPTGSTNQVSTIKVQLQTQAHTTHTVRNTGKFSFTSLDDRVIGSGKIISVRFNDWDRQIAFSNRLQTTQWAK
jgi:hypothetical protein